MFFKNFAHETFHFDPFYDSAVISDRLYPPGSSDSNLNGNGPEYFVEELGTLDFTLKEGLLELLKEIGVEATNPTINKVIDFIEGVLSSQMRVVAISYNTVDPFGKPVLGTGAFVYPLDLQVSGVIEVPP